MKKSDKLLLSTVLLPLVLLTLTYIGLSAKYKAGDFITSKQIHSEQFERVTCPSPGYLMVQGFERVNIIASDTFAIEYDKREGRKMYKIDQEEVGVQSGYPKVVYEKRGDTLLITGYDTLRIQHPPSGKEREVLNNFRSVNLYCRNIPTMLFHGGQIIIQQNKRPALGPSTLLLLENSNFSLGDLSGDHPDTADYHYDSLQVKAIQSIVSLNPHALIGKLRVELDSSSSFYDVSARIGQADIRFTDRTSLSLTGANLRKVISH